MYTRITLSDYPFCIICLTDKSDENNYLYVWNTEVFQESSKTSKTELSVNIAIDGKPLTAFAKSSILDVYRGYEYASGISKVNIT